MRRKSNPANNIMAAVVATLVVAGVGGYMLGQRSGEKQALADVAVVASVNDEQITDRDLYKRLVGSTGLNTLNEMITEKLVAQAAEEAKVTVSAEEIDKEINKVKEGIGGEEKFQAALTAEGLSLETLRERVALNLKVTKILSKDLALTDKDLQEYFAANIVDFDKREVHARYIRVETGEEARAIKAELDGGADFAELAKAKSNDTVTKGQGGDLGFIGRTVLSPTLSDAAFNLKVNEISAPVETETGWHIVQVLETRGTAPEFSAVKEDVRTAMVQAQVQSKVQPWITELREKAKINNTLEPKAQTR